MTHCWERATPWRIFVDHTAHERHWSGALPAKIMRPPPLWFARRFIGRRKHWWPKHWSPAESLQSFWRLSDRRPYPTDPAGLFLAAEPAPSSDHRIRSQHATEPLCERRQHIATTLLRNVKRRMFTLLHSRRGPSALARVRRKRHRRAEQYFSTTVWRACESAERRSYTLRVPCSAR